MGRSSLCVLLLAMAGRTCGQFPLGSATYAELSSYAAADVNHTTVTQGDPLLISAYHPDKYLLPRSFYTLSPTDLITQNVIFDPCRGQPYNCCQDTFGTPEFERVDAAPLLPSGAPNPAFGTYSYLYADGSPTPINARRRPRDQLVIDPTCRDLLQPRADCVAKRVSRQAWPSMPVCWNWNASVNAGLGCRAPLDGSPLQLCLELGYTQNAYVADCGGPYAGSEHCGTYLEVHRPGREEKLAEVRLPGVLPSGYRMTVISTTYKRDPALVLCYDPVKGGRYEVWWVLRALDGFYVQKRMPFTVVSPLCDWDAVNNRYGDYATVAAAPVLSGFDFFNRSLRLYTQPSVNGTPSAPGRGMGSTQVLLSPPDPRAPPPFFNDTLGTLA